MSESMIFDFHKWHFEFLEYIEEHDDLSYREAMDCFCESRPEAYDVFSSVKLCTDGPPGWKVEIVEAKKEDSFFSHPREVDIGNSGYKSRLMPA